MSFALSNDDGSRRMAELDHLIELEEKRLAALPAAKPRCKCGECAKCRTSLYNRRWRALHGPRQRPKLRPMITWEKRREVYLAAKGLDYEASQAE